jgi:hypothetical protein
VQILCILAQALNFCPNFERRTLLSSITNGSSDDKGRERPGTSPRHLAAAGQVQLQRLKNRFLGQVQALPLLLMHCMS